MPKKPTNGKASKSKGGKAASGDPLLDVFGALDEEALARVRETLRARTQTFEGDDPLTLFEDFLHRLETFAERDIAEDEDFFDDVVMSLTQLGIDENGGDPQARAIKAALNEKLEQALTDGRLDVSGLVLVAKVLTDSGWAVPEPLKARVVESLEAASGTAADVGGGVDLRTTLADIAHAAQGDAFAAHESLNSVLSAFPSEAAAKMVATLASERAPVLLQTLAGFTMHQDQVVAMAAIDELKYVAAAGPIESALVERLVRMRPWLPIDRQGPLDDAIRALRAQALPPVNTQRPAVAKCFVLACDGAGAGGTLTSLKATDGWRFVAAMTKPAGVAEVLSLEGMPKTHVDATVRAMRENVVAAQTDVAGVARYIQLALGENVAAKSPPPFKLIALAENLGLGPLAPRICSPADLIAETLADLPESAKDAAAVARAQKAVTGGALASPWFEAGEAVERLLAPVRGPKARANAVLTAYLPDRREFWTRVCALTAFVLLLDRKTFGSLGPNLALVGREIASGASLGTIPLMRDIATMTVRAYESRM